MVTEIDGKGTRERERERKHSEKERGEGRKGREWKRTESERQYKRKTVMETLCGILGMRPASPSILACAEALWTVIFLPGESCRPFRPLHASSVTLGSPYSKKQ